jgi:ABC-type transporter Mla maintaining outer membrane lipid asymmetry permease subunit MlaE
MLLDCMEDPCFGIATAAFSRRGPLDGILHLRCFPVCGGCNGRRPTGSGKRDWRCPESLLGLLAWFGELASFCAKVFRALLTPPFEGAKLLRQFDSVGAKSLPFVVLAGAATGTVLSMQTQTALSRFGAKSTLLEVIIYSLIRETGPKITGLIVAGRVGAGIGAELGSMRVTEQIDAMEASAIDTHKFLADTRILACVLALLLLTVAADFSGIALGLARDGALGVLWLSGIATFLGVHVPFAPPQCSGAADAAR